ncbi:MAG: hypothetical protein P1P84_25720 [Deferrisomatales bacterium]|nr:hypothetical protein [Deferrisomatales bacterium]
MSVTYNPSQFTKGARAIFMMQAMAEPENYIDRMATYVDSDSASEDYSWMGEPKQLEE